MSKRYRGRPSALNKDTKRDLLYAIRRGLTLRAACDYAGIAYSTLRNWITRAEDEIGRVSQNDRRKVYKREEEYVDFLIDYQKAIADSQVTLADVIKLAAEGGHTSTEKSTKVKREWRANPQNNNKKELLVTEEVTTETVKVSLPDWRAALAMLERRFTEEWGRKQLLEHVGNPDRPIGTVHTNPYTGMEEEEIDDRLNAIVSRLNQKREDRPFAVDGSEGDEGNEPTAEIPTGSEAE